MTPKSLLRTLAAALIFVTPVALLAQNLHVEMAPRPLPAAARTTLDTETAELLDAADARNLLNATLATVGSETGALDLDAADFYCVIHVMKWETSDNPDPEAADDKKRKAAPTAVQHWYVYHGGDKWTRDDFAANNRLFGAKRVWLVFVHLNRPQASYRARYQFTVNPKTPAPFANMNALAGLFFGSGGSTNPHGWGFGSVLNKVPSDIIIQPLQVVDAETSNTFAKLGDAKSLDNEGRYRFDFSVGVPIKAGKELRVDGGAGTAAPAKVDKQNIFALVNLFPQPVDVKSSGLRRVPHLVTGVAIAEKPLDKILVAAGWGPAFANFYVGALLVKQPIADADGDRRDTQFAFGVNLTVKGTKAALDKAEKK